MKRSLKLLDWMFRSPVALISAGLFGIFIAVVSGHLFSIDGLQYYRVAERMAFDRSLVFDTPLIWGAPIAHPITPIGYSLAQVPAVLLAGWARPLQPAFGSTPYDMALLYGVPVYTLSSWVNPLLVALTGGLTFRTAEALGVSKRLAMTVALATILGSPLFFYARADFAQPLTTFLMLGIVAMLIDTFQRRRVAPGVMTVAVALAILTRPVDGAIIAFVALVVLALPLGDWQPLKDGRRQAVQVVLGTLVGLVVMGVVDAIRFGSPFNPGYGADWGGSIPLNLLGETLGPGRGLVWYFPLVLLAPAGAWVLWRRGVRHEVAILVLPVLLYLPMYAKFISLGGWDWGPRYLVPLVPLLGLLASSVALTSRSRTATVLIVVAAIGGGLTNLAHLAVDPLQGFWAVYGNTQLGMPQFWLQFNLDSFPLIGIWHWYNASAGPDIMWLRLAGSTHGASLIVFATLLAMGVLAFIRAWRLSHSACATESLSTPILEPEYE